MVTGSSSVPHTVFCQPQLAVSTGAQADRFLMRGGGALKGMRGKNREIQRGMTWQKS